MICRGAAGKDESGMLHRLRARGCGEWDREQGNRGGYGQAAGSPLTVLLPFPVVSGRSVIENCDLIIRRSGPRLSLGTTAGSMWRMGIIMINIQ